MTTKKIEEKRKAVKKAPAKKVAAKKVTDKSKTTSKAIKAPKEEIKSKMIGKNLITIIDGIKYVVKNPTPSEIKAIGTKCNLFNKLNKIETKIEILYLVDTISQLESSKKAEVKGIKKVIKTNNKKVKKEHEFEVRSLAEQLKDKLESNQLSESERSEILSLLKIEKEVSAEIPEPTITRSPYRGER